MTLSFAERLAAKRPREEGRSFVSDAIKAGEDTNLSFDHLKGEALDDISHFRKMLACEMIAVDARWRDEEAYGQEATEEYLQQDMRYNTQIRKNFIPDFKDDCLKGTQDTAAGFQRSAKSGARHYFTCYDEKRLVGFSALTDWSCYGEEYKNLGTQVSAVYVLPSYERMGIASKLLAMAEHQALQDGVNSLYLEATPPAVELYRKQRYEEAPKDDPHMDTSGSIILGLLMRKDLQKYPPDVSFLCEELPSKQR